MIATLVAMSAMVGGVQAMAPSSALGLRAACDSLYTASQVAYNRGEWSMGDYWRNKWGLCEQEQQEMEESL
jgi:hypothetical protein